MRKFVWRESKPLEHLWEEMCFLDPLGFAQSSRLEKGIIWH